ncbi:MAG: PQQ-binding-like beta-propeller repeat protein [Anaerolineae bacterium]|nr:PQQ-binding-like beta-propeller repeat protein [Anaerolineae bacterium]
MKRWFSLIVLMYLVAAFAAPTHAQEPPDTAQYRGSATRDGYYPAHGVPVFKGVKWVRTLESGALAPLYAEGTLYVPLVQGVLLALDAETGRERWRYTHDSSMISTPIAADGMVYFGAGKDGLYALQAIDGKPLWSFETDGSIWSSPPILLDSVIYTGSDRGTVYALDAKMGTAIWSFTSGESILWSGAASEDSVYFSTWTHLYAIDRHAGTVLWTASTRDKWSAPAVYGGVVYAGNGDNEFLALDAASGDILWRFRAPRSRSAEWSAPTVNEDGVFVGHSSSTLFALDRLTGSLRWQLPVASWATSDALFDGGLLYFGVGEHGPQASTEAASTFYVVRTTTGKVHWTFDTDGLIYAAPALADKVVYVVTTAGQLYALE